jgi:phage terminase large subunit-like protein
LTAGPSRSSTLARALHASSLASLPEEQRRQFLASLTPTESQVLLYDWPFWARPDQLPPPGDWSVWLLLAGRGFGKTRTICELLRSWIDRGRRRLAIVGRTAADVRDVLVKGESGIMECFPPWERPHYEPSNRCILWPNGAQATLYSADKPDQLRGPQHDGAIADELASWRFVEDALSNLMLGLRLGDDPRLAVATTPRPIKQLRELMTEEGTIITSGTTYENLGNLAPTFRRKILARYEGTRLGRQELRGELLEDVQGALWRREEMIEQHRVKKTPDLVRIVIAVDPSGSDNPDADECGIVAAGLGVDGHGYLLDDRSGQLSPAAWSALACTLYHTWKADRLVAEINFGGQMVRRTVQTARNEKGEDIGSRVAFKELHASRGKAARAEPVASLYEQGRIHHVGSFPELEDEQCAWVANSGMRSPNRLDVAVWAFTELMLGPVAAPWSATSKRGSKR